MSSSRTVVRRATPADAPAIAEVHVWSWQSAYRGLIADAVLGALTPERRQPQWEQTLTAPDERIGVWLAEVDGEVVGFSSIGPSPDDDSGMLFTLYLHPERIGTGVGHALLVRAEEGMIAAGFEEATLEVLRDNARARRFYERHGWVQDGEAFEQDWGGGPFSVVAYRKRLGSASGHAAESTGT